MNNLTYSQSATPVEIPQGYSSLQPGFPIQQSMNIPRQRPPLPTSNSK